MAVTAFARVRRGWRGGFSVVAWLFAINFIAACAHSTPASGQIDSQKSTVSSTPEQLWSGRLALKVEDDKEQSFFASFELRGNAGRGSLSLSSPFSTIAQMQWSPGVAMLQASGVNGGQPQPFASVEDMLQRVSGAPIPIAALFDWLAGRAASAPGWQVDLSQHAEGRIVAQRTEPQPSLNLRVVLEK